MSVSHIKITQREKLEWYQFYDAKMLEDTHPHQSIFSKTESCNDDADDYDHDNSFDEEDNKLFNGGVLN